MRCDWPFVVCGSHALRSGRSRLPVAANPVGESSRDRPPNSSMIRPLTCWNTGDEFVRCRREPTFQSMRRDGFVQDRARFPSRMGFELRQRMARNSGRQINLLIRQTVWLWTRGGPRNAATPRTDSDQAAFRAMLCSCAAELFRAPGWTGFHGGEGSRPSLGPKRWMIVAGTTPLLCNVGEGDFRRPAPCCMTRAVVREFQVRSFARVGS